jgi:probable F420-dependent oxidoreductase
MLLAYHSAPLPVNGERAPRMRRMRVDAMLPEAVQDTPQHAAALEAEGYDGLWVFETCHEPFLQLLRAAAATGRVLVGTSVAIALARTPMTVAYAAYDLALYARGRFVLGLGSQVKPHIERRFSMPWSQPARRMREFALALRAIWSAWQDGRPLRFEGEFYTHTLMTPVFTPEAHPFGPPPLYLSGVGPAMTEIAGETGDGFLFHPFTTERYLREVTLPALTRGRARVAATGLEGFGIAGPAFVCTGRDERELAIAVRGTKARIAFYASTPAYRPVLELHGWEALQPELGRLARLGRWEQMGDAVDDAQLRAFAVVGGPREVGAGLRARWKAPVERITLYVNYPSDPAIWPEVLRAIREPG